MDNNRTSATEARITKILNFEHAEMLRDTPKIISADFRSKFATSTQDGILTLENASQP